MYLFGLLQKKKKKNLNYAYIQNSMKRKSSFLGLLGKYLSHDDDEWLRMGKQVSQKNVLVKENVWEVCVGEGGQGGRGELMLKYFQNK